MARNTEYYSQKSHSVVINGVALNDFASGATPIRVVTGGDIGSLTKGLDKSVPNLIYDPTGAIEVDLKNSSPGNDFLSSLAKQQLGGTFLNIAGQVLDGNGAVHSGAGGVIQKRADFGGGGPETATRTWIIIFPDLSPDN